MKKIVLFPFHHDIETLLKNRTRLIDAEIIGVISYKEDNLRLCELCKKYKLQQKTYERTLKDCDTVILLDNYRKYDTKKYYSIIDDAISMGKQILITPLAASQLDLVGYNGQYNLLQNEPANMATINERYHLAIQKQKIYDLDTPVIGIMGQGRNCGKFECQLFTDEIISKECSVTVVSSNSLGALFGYYTMPSFVYSSMPFSEKVFKFNMFMHLLERNAEPDIIIVGIPEGIVPFKEADFNNFAEYALVITSAISVDIAVLCTYFAHKEIIASGIQDIMRFCEERFRLPVGAIYISDVTYEISDSPISDSMLFEFLNDSYTTKYRAALEKSELPVFDLHNKGWAEKVIHEMLTPLGENIKAI